jgi:hypothetical protein
VLFVGMYVKLRLSVNVRHSISSVCRGVMLELFCRPMRAISLLKSPYSIWEWFGCAMICCVICFLDYFDVLDVFQMGRHIYV